MRLGARAFEATFLTVIALPLSGGDHWHALSFGKLRANEVAFSDKELRISVEASASPLFYHFDETLLLRSVFVEGSLTGVPKLPDSKIEGERGADDSPLRFGVVVEGEKKLGWLEKLFAPAWLKRLTEIVPDKPFGGVRFLTLAQTLDVGTWRPHPKSRYLSEEVVKKITAPGPFSFEKIYAEPPRAMGLWLQADGDDTKSSFEVKLNSILLTTAPGEDARGVASPDPTSSR
jgi:hypothetical protein